MNGKRKIKENEKRILYGLRLGSIQWQQKLTEERETNSFRIKTCFQLMGKGT